MHRAVTRGLAPRAEDRRRTILAAVCAAALHLLAVAGLIWAPLRDGDAARAPAVLAAADPEPLEVELADPPPAPAEPASSATTPPPPSPEPAAAAPDPPAPPAPAPAPAVSAPPSVATRETPQTAPSGPASQDNPSKPDAPSKTDAPKAVDDAEPPGPAPWGFANPPPERRDSPQDKPTARPGPPSIAFSLPEPPRPTPPRPQRPANAAPTVPQTLAPIRVTADGPRDPRLPEYPAAARANGLEGDVLLEIEIDGQSRVRSVRVKRGSGHPVLDEAAARAARNWRLRIAGLDAAALGGAHVVSVTVEAPVSFRLK